MDAPSTAPPGTGATQPALPRPPSNLKAPGAIQQSIAGAGQFRLLPYKTLMPITYVDDVNQNSFSLPHEPDLALQVTFKGDEADVPKYFLPVIWAVEPAVRNMYGGNRRGGVSIERSKVTVPPHNAMTYARFVIDSSAWPDTAFGKFWVDHLIRNIEIVVAGVLRKPFRVKQCDFKITSWFENVGRYENDGIALNRNELIDLFLEEEFEFTYRERDAVTIDGIEHHLLYVWFPDSMKAHRDLRPLVADFCQTIKAVHARVLEKQIAEPLRNGNANIGLIKTGRRKIAYANYAKMVEHDKKVAVYIGLRYKRVHEDMMDYKEFEESTLSNFKAAWVEPVKRTISVAHERQLFQSQGASVTGTKRKRGRKSLLAPSESDAEESN